MTTLYFIFTTGIEDSVHGAAPAISLQHLSKGKMFSQKREIFAFDSNFFELVRIWDNL